MPKKSQHTPGLWEIWDEESMDGLDILWTGPGDRDIPESERTICTVRVGNEKANARLIAASPIMFDFIKHFADQPCDELPGEYPEVGESGKSPCYPCQAKELLKKSGL